MFRNSAWGGDSKSEAEPHVVGAGGLGGIVRWTGRISVAVCRTRRRQREA